MRTSSFRKGLCLALMFLMAAPVPLLAADTNAAMVYARGTAWVNGTSVPRSSAVFPGDLVQTRSDSSANISTPGSNVVVLSDSLIKYETNAVELEHGAVTVGTSKNMATRVGNVTITPATSQWTEFQVADVDGTVQILARKGDVTISDQEGTTTLPQGQQTRREESKKKDKKRSAGAVTAAHGGILDSKTALIIGTGIVTGVTAWVLLQDDEPASPDKP